MKEAQEFLEMLQGEGYFPAEIATKLTAVGIRFTLEGENFTILGEDDGDEAVTSGENEQMTIMSCLSDIVESTAVGERAGRRFNSKVTAVCGKQIRYVCGMVGISPMQAVILACIIENKGRRNFGKHDLAGFMGLSFIKLLSFEKDLKALADKRLINLSGEERVSVGRKTVESLYGNKPYTLPSYRGMGTAEILKEMKETIRARENNEINFSDMMADLDGLITDNPDTGFVKVMQKYALTKECGSDYYERGLFYHMVKRYIYNDDDHILWSDFDNIVEDISDIGYIRSAFGREGTYLQRRGVIEPVLEDGMSNSEALHIVDSVKAELFEEVGGVKNSSGRSRLNVTPAQSITARELFYNEAEGEQIGRLTRLLGRESYQATCDRLKSSGMRTGFTCLFYGGPGTGKTESVYQIARETGRGIVAVNVSEIKSCWVGESEKLVKGLFDKYRALVKESEVAPILLFNEADAIFGIRQAGAEKAVDKMENSIQNIILQEMEKLEGILIATTNLTENLDKAFERRFLYKIRFNRPETGPKAKIWKYMIPDLSEDQAFELARDYDFSGGQIENISRKKMIKSIIDGVEPEFKEIRSYCGEELIDGKGGDRRKIGY